MHQRMCYTLLLQNGHSNIAKQVSINCLARCKAIFFISVALGNFLIYESLYIFHVTTLYDGLSLHITRKDICAEHKTISKCILLYCIIVSQVKHEIAIDLALQLIHSTNLQTRLSKPPSYRRR